MRHLLAFVVTSLAAVAQTPAPAPDFVRNPAFPATALNPALPTLFIAGDSTAARGRGATQQGWGVPFADYFDPAKINVANRARGGRSSRTFLTEGLWDQMLAQVKKGDTVLIQFGHNDGGPINDEPPPPLRARGSLRGLGEETKEIDNVLTKKREVVHTFGWYLRKMIADVQAKGAAFVDLHELIARRYDELGPEKVNPFFADERVHTSAAGAECNAARVVEGLKALPRNPIAAYLR